MLVAFAATTGITACGDPGAPDIPDLSDGRLHFFGVLVADSGRHEVHVSQVDAVPIERLDGVLSEVGPGGTLTPIATAVPVVGQGTGFVLAFEATIRPGRRYQVTVTAPGRPQATAATTVPGDFDFESLVGDGDPPGTTRLRASWSTSAGAFRYIVNVRAVPDCMTQPPLCETFGLPWADVTPVPRIDTIVPGTAIPADRTEGVEVAVYAVNRDLFEYFTTGVGGTFTVQPKQNVSGGYGVLGAWVRRVRVMDRERRPAPAHEWRDDESRAVDPGDP